MLVLLYLSLVASALAQFSTPENDGAFVPAVQESAARCITKCMMYPAPLKRACLMDCPTRGSSGFDVDFAIPALNRDYFNPRSVTDCYDKCIAEHGNGFTSKLGCTRECMGWL